MVMLAVMVRGHKTYHEVYVSIGDNLGASTGEVCLAAGLILTRAGAGTMYTT